MGVPSRAFFSLEAACLLAGCAAAPASPPRPREQVPVEQGAAFVSPAHWECHPPAPAAALAAVKLPDGGCVFTAEGGQRWSSAAAKQVGSRLVCAGRATAGSALANEDLTSAVRRADGSWIFFGASGTLLEAAEPLGPFGRRVPAPEPLSKVAAAGPGVLAATQEGRMLRWEPSSGWRPLPASPALASARVFDVVVDDHGHALALAFPEALLASEDGGATWVAVRAPSIGARMLGRTSAGALGAQGLFASLVWQPGGLARGHERIHNQQAALEVEVGRGPSATAVQAGRAVLDGDRYYEVVRPDNDGAPWLLAVGRIEGRLETTPIPDSSPCGSMHVGARGKTVFIVCVTQGDSSIVAGVQRTVDLGRTWSDRINLVTPDTDQIQVAVSDGAALVSGVCRTSDANGACKPTVPLLVRSGDAAASGLRASPVTAPQLAYGGQRPAFSVDGRAAYFLGRRGKDERFNIFVSHDGGQAFYARPIEPPANKPMWRADPDEPSEGDINEVFDVTELSTLTAGDDGTIGVVLFRMHGGDHVYVTADEDGRILQVASLPVEGEGDEAHPVDAVLAGHGRRVLAVPSAGDPGAAVWESVDGGASWDRQAPPPSLVREYDRAVPSIACALGGCVIGETVTRVGWGGQADTGGLERPEEAPAGGVQSVLTPIVCELSSTSRWSRIEDAYSFNADSSAVPGVHQAMRGRSVWSALSVDRRSGAITSSSATLPESGEGEARVVTHRLFGARPAGQHVPTAVSATQHEGYAAARVAVPVDAKGQLKPGATMRNVEVVWENFFEDNLGHGRIADAGPLQSADVTLGERRYRRDGKVVDALNASLISITSRGIFVRPHAQGAEFFLDGKGRVERCEAPSWPKQLLGTPLDMRADAGAIGGGLVSVGLFMDAEREWAAVGLARRDAQGAWTFGATSLLPPRPPGAAWSAFTSWAWAAKGPLGIAAILADPSRRRAHGHFVAFRGDGTFAPAEPVPTIVDLGDRPRGCTPAERASTPRVNALFWLDGNRAAYPGMRHPVLVREQKPKGVVSMTDEPIVLLTAGAVVQGSPASACISAWEASAVGRRPGRDGGGMPELGAILPGDLAHAWLFRSSYDASSEPVAVLEYRPMTCRYDPSARVPDAVWAEPGTSRPY